MSLLANDDIPDIVADMRSLLKPPGHELGVARDGISGLTVGGLPSSTLLTLVLLPLRFEWVHERRARAAAGRKKMGDRAEDRSCR